MDLMLFRKKHLSTCLRMHGTPEVDKIDSKRMHVDAMINQGEVTFSKECKRLLDLCDEVDTKGNKKHAKLKAKARLKHKYYLVHKETEMFSTA